MPNVTVDQVMTFTSIIDNVISSSSSMETKASSEESSTSSIKESVGRLFENYVDGIAALAARDNTTLTTSTTNMFISSSPAAGTKSLPSLGIIYYDSD